MSKNVPDRNAIGSTMKFASADAASSVLETEPTRRPIARNARVPATQHREREPPVTGELRAEDGSSATTDEDHRLPDPTTTLSPDPGADHVAHRRGRQPYAGAAPACVARRPGSGRPEHRRRRHALGHDSRGDELDRLERFGLDPLHGEGVTPAVRRPRHCWPDRRPRR